MKKYKSERIQLLHDKLDKHKDDILKDKAEGMSNLGLAKKYGINAFTLGDYIYLWKNGVNRRRAYQKEYQKGISPERGVRKFKKKEFSKQLKTQMKINSEINKRLVKHVKVNNSQDAKMIRYICGVKV